jgi:hypothetical protein
MVIASPKTIVQGSRHELERRERLLFCINQLYNYKSVRRIEKLNLVQSFLRTLMLANLLNFPFSSYIDETLVTLFGIISNSIGIAKQISLIKAQKHMLKQKDGLKSTALQPFSMG